MTTTEERPTTAGTERGFPPGFVWGTATASYQVEGAVAEDGRTRVLDVGGRPVAERRWSASLDRQAPEA